MAKEYILDIGGDDEAPPASQSTIYTSKAMLPAESTLSGVQRDTYSTPQPAARGTYTSPTATKDAASSVKTVGRGFENLGVGIAGQSVGAEQALLEEFTPESFAPEYKSELARKAAIVEQRRQEDPFNVYGGEILSWFAPVDKILAAPAAISRGAKLTAELIKSALTPKKKFLTQTAETTARMAGSGYAQGFIQPVSGETEEQRQQQRRENASTAAEFSGILGTMAPSVARGADKVTDMLSMMPSVQTFVGTISKKAGEATKERGNASVVKSLANEVSASLEKINIARKASGKPPISPEQAINNIDVWVNEIGRVNKEYGTGVALSVADLAEAPYLTAVLRRYQADTGQDIARLISDEENYEQFAKIFSSKDKKADTFIEQIASDLFAKRSTNIAGVEAGIQATSEDLALQKSQLQRQIPTVEGPSVATPSEVSRFAAAEVKNLDQQAKAALTDSYNSLEKDAAPYIQATPQRLQTWLNGLLSNAGSETEKLAILDNLPDLMVRRLKIDKSTGKIGATDAVNYNDILLWTQQAQTKVNAAGTAVDPTLYAIRDALGATSLESRVAKKAGLKDTLLAEQAPAELIARKNAIDAQYKSYANVGRRDITTAEGLAVGQVKNPLIAEIRQSPSKAFNDVGWLGKVTSNARNLDEVVAEYPSVAPFANDFLLSNLDKVAKGRGISSKTLNTFIETNKDVLSSPNMAGAKSVLDDLSSQLKGKETLSEKEYNAAIESIKKTAGQLQASRKLLSKLKLEAKTSTEKSILDSLAKPSRVDSLFTDPRKTQEFVDFATRTNTLDDLRNIYKESLNRRLIDVDSTGTKKLTQSELVDKLLNFNSTEREVASKVFSKEQMASIDDALTLLKKQDSAIKPTPEQDIAGAIVGLGGELLGILSGKITPAQATRLGALSDLFGAEQIRMMAKQISVDPEMAKKFLRTVDNPTRNNLTGLFKSLDESVGKGVGAFGANYFKDSYQLQQDLGGYDIMYDGGSAGGGIPAGKVPTEQAPSSLAPQSKLDPETTPAPQTPEDHAKLAVEAAKMTGISPELAIVTMSSESSMGRNVGNSSTYKGPMQMGPAAREEAALTAKKYAGLDLMPYQIANNPVANIIGGAAYLKHVKNEAQKAMGGRTPQPWETYIAYNMGPGAFRVFEKLRKQGDDRTPVVTAFKKAGITPGNKEMLYADGTPLTAKEFEKAYIQRYNTKLREALPYARPYLEASMSV